MHFLPPCLKGQHYPGSDLVCSSGTEQGSEILDIIYILYYIIIHKYIILYSPFPRPTAPPRWISAGQGWVLCTLQPRHCPILGLHPALSHQTANPHLAFKVRDGTSKNEQHTPHQGGLTREGVGAEFRNSQKRSTLGLDHAQGCGCWQPAQRQSQVKFPKHCSGQFWESSEKEF